MQPTEASDDIPLQVALPVVEAVQARSGALPLSERVNGTVVSDNQVALYPEISGRITRVVVRDGDLVKRGDPLVYLADREIRERLEQAEASYQVRRAAIKQAQAQLREVAVVFERTEALAREGLISEVEVETLRAQVESSEADIELVEAQARQAQAAINEAREVLEKSIIRAPITGSVGQRNAEVGMQVSSSSRLFTIGNLGELRVRVVLTERMLEEVRVGNKVRVYFGTDEADQGVLDARLSRISPFLNTTTRSTEAEIDLSTEDNPLRPGMFVAVDVLYGESEAATLVPTSALYTDPTTRQEGVYVLRSVRDLDVEQSELDTPSRLSDPLEIVFQPVTVIAQGRLELGIQGLDPGKWVVTLGQNLLAEGRTKARVRFTSWNHIIELQQLQRQDLLQQVLDTLS